MQLSPYLMPLPKASGMPLSLESFMPSPKGADLMPMGLDS